LDALRACMEKVAPHFADVDEVANAKWGAFGRAGKVDKAAFNSPIDDFYMTDAICRASKTMAKCSLEILGSRQKATGTDG
jgi:NADH-quinone oxidoreductase subunit G